MNFEKYGFKSEEDFAKKITEEQTGVKVNILQQFETYETQSDGKNSEERVFEALPEEGETGGELVSAKWVKKSAIKAAEIAESLKQVLVDLKS